MGTRIINIWISISSCQNKLCKITEVRCKSKQNLRILLCIPALELLTKLGI